MDNSTSFELNNSLQRVEQGEKSRSRSRVSVGQIAIGGTPSYAFKSKLTGPMAPNGA